MLVYLDASAVVKLVRAEPETAALTSYLEDAEMVSCELVLTEVARAVRRAAAVDAGVPLEELLMCSEEVLDTIALLSVDRGLVVRAAAIGEPSLRALDALHVAAALSIPVVAFVSYDERQAAAARLLGLRTVAPG